VNTNQIELFVHPPSSEEPNALLQIALKLLDWPFLMTVVFIIFIFVFRKQLMALLDRKDILVNWGGSSIRLRDLEENIDKEIDPLRDQVETLKQAEQSANKTKPLEGVEFINTREPSVDALTRMKNALRPPNYRWRTIPRLASIAAISEDEAKSLLRSDPEIVLSTGKSGNQIARLRSR
jgi:hypothetical protein